MFSRVQFEDGYSWIAILAFLLITGAFIYFLFRAIRMSKSEAQQKASLPLEEETIKSEQRH